jgi:hypothetical protein
MCLKMMRTCEAPATHAASINGRWRKGQGLGPDHPGDTGPAEQGDHQHDHPDVQLTEKGRQNQHHQQGGHDHDHVRQPHEQNIGAPSGVSGHHADGGAEKDADQS